MFIFKCLFMFFVVMSSFVYAMQNEDGEDKQKHVSLIKKLGEDISNYKRKPYSNPNDENEEKSAQVLFDAYMHKAASHFYLEQKDEQLACYTEILRIPGVSRQNLARIHVNISLVYLHLKRMLLAVGHLQKAESLASLQDIEKVMGARTYHMFANVYEKAAQFFYLSHPQQALTYLTKALQVPKQDEGWYGNIHLGLAVLYDRLLKSDESLNHTLQALSCKSLSSDEHDKALCFAALGSAGVSKPDACIWYFEQIKNLKKLQENECFLLLSTVGSCYLSSGKWNRGIALRHQAIEALDRFSPQYVIAKHSLATAYGESGDKEKEIDLYNEILETIEKNPVKQEWHEPIQSIQMLIKAFLFMKEITELEEQARRSPQQKNKQRETRDIPKKQPATQEEKGERRQENERRKEGFRQRRIEIIRQLQKEAVEREHLLAEEKKKETEKEKNRVEERKSRLSTTSNDSYEEMILSQPSRYIAEEKPSKNKTRGIPDPQLKTPEAVIQPSAISFFPTFPKLGTRAQAVYDQLENEDWSFTRQEYSHYLEDLRCTRRESGSSHRVFQLPKTTIITLEKDGQKIQKHIFLADEDVKLGSVTLPAWKEKQIPFYLRKQLRNLHEKIIKMYTKVTKIQSTTEP